MTESVTFDVIDDELAANLAGSGDLQGKAIKFAEKLRSALGKNGLVLEQLSPTRIRVIYPKSLRVHASFVIDGAKIRNGLALSRLEQCG